MQFRSLMLFIATALWCLLAILPFASPVHYVPLPQWWGEMLTVWLTLGAGIFLACSGTLFERLPRATVWCFILALCWALQPYWLTILFPGMNDATALAWVVMAFLAGITVTLRDEWGSASITRWLAWALVIGALVQSLIGLTQLTGTAHLMNGLIFYDSAHPTTNIFGHIGQRNQYAHYLMWGMLAGVYLFVTAQTRWSGLRSTLFIVWTIWLSVMLAYAASRTVVLYVIASFIISVIWHARIRTATSRRLMLSMLFACCIIMLLQFLLPYIAQIVSAITHTQAQVSSGVARLASNGDDMSSRRFAEMHKAWLVFKAYPLGGVGWSQFAQQSVKLQMLPQFANDGFNSGLFTNAHNLVLQLLAEMGGLVTLVVILGFCWVIWPYFSQKAQLEGVLPLSCMAVTLIHSMLEYPLWYLYFLAMLVIFSALAPRPDRCHGKSLAVFWRLILFVAIIVVGVVSLNSYRYYEQLVGLYNPTNQAQQDQQRIKRLDDLIQNHPLYAFHALYNLDNYIEATPTNLQQKHAWIDLMAAFRPYPDVLLKQAEMQAMQGQAAQSQQTLSLALASFPTYARDFIDDLQEGPASWVPLRRMSSEAYARLPAKYRGAAD